MIFMGLFRKKAAPVEPDLSYPSEHFEPVLRSSICTGEKTACMRDRKTGQMHEIMLIRDPSDLEQFGKKYGVDTSQIKTVY